MEYSTAGIHIVADLWSIEQKIIEDHIQLIHIAKNSAETSGANIISVQFKEFDPSGITILIMLAESHLSVHTYPEKSFVAIDCYTCGENLDSDLAVHQLISYFNPGKISLRKLTRGVGSIEDIPFDYD